MDNQGFDWVPNQRALSRSVQVSLSGPVIGASTTYQCWVVFYLYVLQLAAQIADLG